jgi:hypothetical protein
MDYNNCFIEFELGDGKTGLVIAQPSRDKTLLVVAGKQLESDERDARTVYNRAKDMWELVNVWPVKHTITPLGPDLPTWQNIVTFPKVACQLKEMRWRTFRWKPSIDDGPFWEWVVELSQPVLEIGAYDENGYYSEDFVNLITHHLYETYGFQYGSGLDTPPGHKYMAWGFDVDGSIVTAYNHGQRNV